MRVAAIILNYRTPSLVVDCLETLVPQIDPALDEAIVVDNHSGDGSAEAIRAAITERGWSGVRLIESPRNGGFAAGNNVGIRAGRARAYLLLNSDTLLRPGALETLWSALDTNPRAGLVSPRLEWPDGTPQISCFRYHTPVSELMKAAETGPIDHLLKPWTVAIPLEERALEPDWTSFAAVMIRGEVIDTVGFLDEGYFMYYEDTDYCRRARAAGWVVRHVPEARVVHLRGGTSPVKELTRQRRRRPRYYYASRSRYFSQAYGRRGRVAANTLWTLGRGIAFLREALRHKRPHTVEWELWDNWRG